MNRKRLLVLLGIAASLAAVFGFATAWYSAQYLPDHATMDGTLPQTGAALPENKLTQDIAVIVPDEVQAKWSGVYLTIENKIEQISREYAVDIGSELEVPNTTINIKVLAFLPDYIKGDVITSASDRLNNPAVQLVVLDGGKEVWKGWLYSLHPGIQPFRHEKVSIALFAGKQKDDVVSTTVVNTEADKEISGLILDLTNSDPAKRIGAAQKLGETQSRAAVDALIEATKDGNSGVSIAAQNALGKIGDPKAVPALLAAMVLDKTDTGSAQSALMEIGQPAIPSIISALKDNPIYRRGAIGVVGQIRDPRSTIYLIGALQDGDSYVRQIAIVCLGRIGDKQAVEPLIARLHDIEWRNRQYAAEALGKLKDSRAIEPLIEAMKDKEGSVAQSADSALLGITGAFFLSGYKHNYELWSDWWKRNKKGYIQLR